MKARAVLVTLACVLSWPPAASSQQCNPLCQQQLQQRGAPAWDIMRLCCQQQVPGPIPGGQFGSACISQVGRCGLFQPQPLGTQCFCPTPMGPARGMVGQ